MRILFQGNDMDDHDIFFMKSIGADAIITVLPVGSGGGGVKRKLEDKMNDASHLIAKTEANVSPDNQYMPELHQLHAKVVNGENVFEEFLRVIPESLAQKLSEKWYSTDQTGVDRLVDLFWHCLHKDFAKIHKAEEDASQAKRVITSLLTFAYYKQFPDKQGVNCDHGIFQDMIDKRMAEFEREREIERRVQERLQSQNVQMDDPRA